SASVGEAIAGSPNRSCAAQTVRVCPVRRQRTPSRGLTRDPIPYDDTIAKEPERATKSLGLRLNPLQPGGVEAVEAGHPLLGIRPVAGQGAQLSGGREKFGQIIDLAR